MCTGCGEYYVLTTPDQVAPLGQDAPVVIRLQLKDMFFVLTPAKDQPMRFSVRGGPERVAHTDEQGYAGAVVPAPDRAGRFLMTIDLTDSEGEELHGLASLYVWDASLPVVVVDADFLPLGRRAGPATRALKNMIARGTNIAYLTRRQADEHYQVHDRLSVGGYPAGPVLQWRRQRYRIIRESRFRRRIIVENRLVSQLDEMRTMFPNMTVGICDSTLAAKAFVEVGLEAVIVGNADPPKVGASRRTTWRELAKDGR